MVLCRDALFLFTVDILCLQEFALQLI
jgi:hypothetical protein